MLCLEALIEKHQVRFLIFSHFSLLLTSVVSALPALLPAPANMWDVPDVDNIPDMGQMVLEDADAEMANLNFPDDEAIEDNNSYEESEEEEPSGESI